jgi:cobalt-zinc-cadmium efflux system outer membrane protein
MYIFSSLRLVRSARRWHAWLMALGFLSVSPGAVAAEVSFDDALRLAVERAPLLRARQSQETAAREESARAAALPDPTLTFGLSNWPVTGPDAFDLRADDMTMQQIGVMQTFPARAKRQARQSVANRTVELTQAQSNAERLAVRQSVALAWLDQWTAQREVDALRELREPALLAVRTAKARLAGGTGSVTDVLSAQAAAQALESRLDAAEAGLLASRAGLARWLGSGAEDVQVIGDPPNVSVLSIDPAAMLASVDRHGPLLAWRAREAMADASIDAAIAEKRPDWSLGATYGRRERMPSGGRRSDMLMIEVSVDLSLFARNRQDRGVAARRAEREAVAAEREDARRAQTETVRRVLAEWQGLQRQVARLETDILPLARDRSRTALAAYAGGSDLQPWLDARRDELESQLEHAQRLGDLGRAWAVLAFLLSDEETRP